MSRDHLWTILGSLLLFSMAYLDAGWRWFWAIAGGVMLLGTLHSSFHGDDFPGPKF